MSRAAGQSAFRRAASALVALAICANLTGCVQRRFTIRSNPPGAQVYVDDYEIGTTPVSHDFTYYGTRKIRLVKDGCETLTVYQPMPTPWYQWPGLDFFSDNLWPHEIRDERSFNYQLTPTIEVPAEQLLGRAEQLRAASRVQPAANVQPIVGPAPVETLPAPPPASTPAIQTAPPSGAILPPPAGAAPAPGYLPPPNNLAPPTGAVPNYGAPGGYLPGSIAPQTQPPTYTLPPNVSPQPSGPTPNYGVPGGNSTVPALPTQPVVPPGWRPIGEVPSQNVQR